VDAWTESQTWNKSWETLHELPSGAQAAAKHARHRETGAIAFLKVLNRSRLPERRARFFREASAYDTFRHRGLPRLVESNAHRHASEDHKLYLATEYIDGITLAKWLDTYGPAPLEDTAAVLLELLDVVEYLHRENWIHRDIKPANIMLRDAKLEQPVLVDFGLTHKEGLTPTFNTEHGQEIGNRFLRLPELSAGSAQKQDVRSDVTFLGGILFYTLTGTEPVQLLDAEGRMPHQRTATIAPLQKSADAAYMELLEFFDRCFSQRLPGRYSSASEMRTAFSQLLERTRRSAHPSSLPTLESIVAQLDTQASRALAGRQALFDAALNAVAAVHREILEHVPPPYGGIQGGCVPAANSKQHMLGIGHAAIPGHQFAPTFFVTLVGDELIVRADQAVIYRTGLEAPDFGTAFRDTIRAFFLSGLAELAKRPLPLSQ
jgi:serine/threonine protein kinase